MPDTLITVIISAVTSLIVATITARVELKKQRTQWRRDDYVELREAAQKFGEAANAYSHRTGNVAAFQNPLIRAIGALRPLATKPVDEALERICRTVDRFGDISGDTAFVLDSIREIMERKEEGQSHRHTRKKRIKGDDKQP